MGGSHIHQYKRIKIGKKKDYVVYRCMRSGCSHYIAAAFIEGKQSVCWSCDSPFTITHKLLRIKPLCEDCKEMRKKGQRAQPIENIDIEKMLAEVGAKEEDPF